jgi:uncharacterized protein YutE (UPF0331/DUF86 family)
VVEPETIRSLLDTIEERLRRLQDLTAVTLEAYARDTAVQDRVERNFEVGIQACIDLGLHILADLPRPIPESNRAVFGVLAEEGILDRPLAAELEKMAGFRNLLAHGYGRLVPERVHANLSRLDDIRSYVRQIGAYLHAGSG